MQIALISLNMMFLNIFPSVLARFGRSWARFDRINPPDTDRIRPRIGYGSPRSYPWIILGDHWRYVDGIPRALYYDLTPLFI